MKENKKKRVLKQTNIPMKRIKKANYNNKSDM